jgi:hypothetical protein
MRTCQPLMKGEQIYRDPARKTEDGRVEHPRMRKRTRKALWRKSETTCGLIANGSPTPEFLQDNLPILEYIDNDVIHVNSSDRAPQTLRLLTGFLVSSRKNRLGLRCMTLRQQPAICRP